MDRGPINNSATRGLISLGTQSLIFAPHSQTGQNKTKTQMYCGGDQRGQGGRGELRGERPFLLNVLICRREHRCTHDIGQRPSCGTGREYTK